MAAVLPFLAVSGLVTWGAFLALRGASRWWLTRVRIPAAEFLLPPEGVAFFLLAGILGLFAGAVLMSLVARALLGRTRYDEWALASRYGLGFDGHRVVALIASIAIPAATWLSLLEADAYVYVTRSEFVMNPFWGFAEDRRLLSDVVAVFAVDGTTGPDGKQSRPPHFGVRFRDGSQWTTRDGGRSPRPAIDRPLVEHVAARAGVPLQPAARPPPSPPG
jgi:hypothetical protein